jgi:hypothetical protein
MGKLQARLATTLWQCPTGGTINYKNTILHSSHHNPSEILLSLDGRGFR